MSAKRASFWKDESGAAYIEFTVSVLTFLTILFGVIEFSNVYFQWNAATKATQFGARLAAVSNPVYQTNPMDFTETVSGYSAGQTLAAGAYSFTCSGAGSGSCACTGAVCPQSISYNLASMQTLVYGRGRISCSTTPTVLTMGMCNLFPRNPAIIPANVVVRYDYTGLGYAGRPGGPVPTITVSLTGLTYNWLLLNGITTLTAMTLPPFSTTVTGEDLLLAGPP